VVGWSIEQAREHYNIAQWSQGYFDISQEGHLCAHPYPERAVKIDLPELMEKLIAHGLRFPILIRFTDILQHRVYVLQTAFAKAMEKHAYTGGYLSVYPIKTNQQLSVAEVIQQQPNVGLESGSKSELLAVLALAGLKPSTTIICNGYKDKEYIRFALIGQQLGHKVFIIIEKLSELALVLDEAAKMNVSPLLGVRVRLASIAKGKWQNTGGEKSKFGLTAYQILQCIEQLKTAKKLECLQLMHCHLGSQISNIRDIQQGVNECAHYYTELHSLGASIRYFDIGGGLGVDYEGTNSRSVCSINYSWEEYANCVVNVVTNICQQYNLPEPQLVTESGRGLTAHHAVLVTNIIGVEKVDIDMPLPVVSQLVVLQQMQDAHKNISARNALEVYHEMDYWLKEMHQQFQLGYATLQERAAAEQIYARSMTQVRRFLQPDVRHHQEIIEAINQKLADKIFCNFSVFQSLPDVWAIEQVFPIMPLSHLDKRPVRRAILQDLTCDSDGRIDNYVDGQGIEASLPLPDCDETGLYLGFFMIGAYQEILGDLHNLFGDTDSVHVRLNAKGDYDITNQQAGESSAQVLRSVSFDETYLTKAYQYQMQRANLPASLKQEYLAYLEYGLQGYTYLEEE
jgi:arginine decarboxylase